MSKPVKFWYLTYNEKTAKFYDILRSNDEDVAFFYQLPLSDGSQSSRFKFAVLDLKKITEDLAGIRQQIQDCATLAEKLAKNCRT